MKKFTAIILAVLLMMLMVVPVFADEEVTATAGHFTAEEGNIVGGYESDGLVNIYVDDALAGGSTLNVAAAEGEHVVTVYENGVLVATETVTVGATEEPTPAEDPTPAGDDTPAPAPTPSGGGEAKPASNVPKTGDAENMGTFMVLGLAAALTLVAAKRIKSR